MSGVAPDAGEIRKLGVNSSIYVVVTIVTRGIQILLVPVYTHFLTPGDFGILAITTTLASIVGGVASFGITGAVTRMHHESATDGEKRRFFGLLVGFLLIAPALVIAGLELIGARGWVHVGDIPFEPYIKLALLTAYAGCWPSAASALYVVEERPRRAAALQVLAAAAQSGSMLVFLVPLHQGVLGAVRAQLVATTIAGAVGLVLVLRAASFPTSLKPLWHALAFSIPLIPHSIFQWALAVSDRYVLVRSVGESELGRYALAYQFNDILLMLAVAINSSFSPMVIRLLKADPHDNTVPRLGTYAFSAVAVAALGAALLGPELLALVTPGNYHGAGAFVPWVALGGAFYGLYLIVAQGTVFSMRMAGVPVMSLIATALNVGLNLWLVPRYGAMVAAVTTAITYAALAALNGALSYRLFVIHWEYRRLMLLLGLGIGCVLVGELARGAGLPIRVVWKSFLFLVIFPSALKVTRFLAPDEVAKLRSMASQLLRRFRPAGH